MRTLALISLVALVGCKTKDKPGEGQEVPNTGTAAGTPTGSPTGLPTGGSTDPCGDGEVQAPEECDYGLENGAGAPCLEDCTINPDLTLSVDGDDLSTWGVDGVAVADRALTGSGCWQATPSEDTNGDGADKFELFLDPDADGMDMLRGATVDDLARIEFSTHKSEGPNSGDFYFVVYTSPDLVDDQALWYGYRLIGEPLYSRNLDAPADQWNTWSTAAGTNQLTWFDSHKANLFGFVGTQPTLDELQASTAFDWSSVIYTGDQTAIDYGAEPIELLSIQTGAPWESTFAGCLDDIQIELANGYRLTVDLEP